MAGMGQPNLTIAFHKAAEEVVNRLKNGIVAAIVRDTGAEAGLYTLADPEDMPSGLGAEVQAYITRAFQGGDGKPQKVLLSVIGAEDDLVEVGCAALASSDFDYWRGMPPVSGSRRSCWRLTAPPRQRRSSPCCCPVRSGRYPSRWNGSAATAKRWYCPGVRVRSRTPKVPCRRNWKKTNRGRGPGSGGDVPAVPGEKLVSRTVLVPVRWGEGTGAGLPVP